MLKLKKLSEAYDMKVFTDNGDYFGDVEEAILTSNKVFGWRVKATKLWTDGTGHITVSPM